MLYYISDEPSYLIVKLTLSQFYDDQRGHRTTHAC